MGVLSSTAISIASQATRLGKGSSVMVSQLCYEPVVTYCMVYHYTKKATLARLLANEGPAIYIVYLNRYFCYTFMILFSSYFFVTHGAR